MKFIVVIFLLALFTFPLAQQKWEYGALSIVFEKGNIFSFEWTSRGNSISGETEQTINEFFKAMTGEEYDPEKFGPGFTGLMNFLGNEGWELVGISEFPPSSVFMMYPSNNFYYTYEFKRPK